MLAEAPNIDELASLGNLEDETAAGIDLDQCEISRPIAISSLKVPLATKSEAL
jgi:hypothetical protein